MMSTWETLIFLVVILPIFVIAWLAGIAILIEMFWRDVG